jgi:triacylglycerol lipase
MDYIYFENGNKFPFDDKSSDYSHVNAWWLSECSFLVYSHPGFARMAFELSGYENFRFFQGKGTECMVAWNKKRAIISFRGTELQSLSTLHEVKTDLNTLPVDFNMGGKVHKGFLNALDEIWGGEDGLFFFIRELQVKHPKMGIWITGHSLGGALAALCFSRIEEASGAYIFGSPRVGDGEFTALTEHRNIWRVEHNRDPIPMVPPNMPSLNFNFEDLGGLKYIDEQGTILDKRQERTTSEYKKIVKNTITKQVEKRKSLGFNLQPVL